MNMPKVRKGFTLIEILLVVAILSILLVVVYAALNPATRLQETRNARRWNDVNQILTAVHECLIDNDGSYTTCGLTSPQVETQIGDCVSGGATLCTAAVAACDNNVETALANYINSIPEDPQSGSDNTTAYSVKITNGIVTIKACAAENGEAIQVSR
jgi:prepilin-type N-terminal cleavage/methylation domain-containing protein